MLICSNCIRGNERATELMFAEAGACSSSGHLLGDFTGSAALEAKTPLSSEGRHHICTYVSILDK